MEIMKFSNAFKPTQPTENATEVTTWHWASNCRPPNDFADMLENIFSGHPNNPSPPPQLAEADSNLQKVLITIKGMKANESFGGMRFGRGVIALCSRERLVHHS